MAPAFDNAISPEAAATKHIVSPVAGQADILLGVPTSNPATCSQKQLTYLAGADSAGIVLGVRVPIVLTSRAGQRARAGSVSTAVMKLVRTDRRAKVLAQSLTGKRELTDASDAIVVLNAGSSSLKFSLYGLANGAPVLETARAARGADDRDALRRERA